jgi:hypothetical protein
MTIATRALAVRSGPNRTGGDRLNAAIGRWLAGGDPVAF